MTPGRDARWRRIRDTAGVVVGRRVLGLVVLLTVFVVIGQLAKVVGS